MKQTHNSPNLLEFDLGTPFLLGHSVLVWALRFGLGTPFSFGHSVFIWAHSFYLGTLNWALKNRWAHKLGHLKNVGHIGHMGT